jgi:hypothetical protein
MIKSDKYVKMINKENRKNTSFFKKMADSIPDLT